MAIPAASMLKARLGSNAMGHFWWQSSGSVDLDHVRRPVASCIPSEWPLPQQRQRVEEAPYNALSSVIGTRPRGRSPPPIAWPNLPAGIA